MYAEKQLVRGARELDEYNVLVHATLQLLGQLRVGMPECGDSGDASSSKWLRLAFNEP